VVVWLHQGCTNVYLEGMRAVGLEEKVRVMNLFKEYGACYRLKTQATHTNYSACKYIHCHSLMASSSPNPPLSSGSPTPATNSKVEGKDSQEQYINTADVHGSGWFTLKWLEHQGVEGFASACQIKISDYKAIISQYRTSVMRELQRKADK